MQGKIKDQQIPQCQRLFHAKRTDIPAATKYAKKMNGKITILAAHRCLYVANPYPPPQPQRQHAQRRQVYHLNAPTYQQHYGVLTHIHHLNCGGAKTNEKQHTIVLVGTDAMQIKLLAMKAHIVKIGVILIIAPHLKCVYTVGLIELSK